MKRYYLAEIERIEEDGETGYRCRASAYPGLLFEGGEILTDGNGVPVHRFTLVLVKEADHARLIGDPLMHPLPQVDLDVTISGIPAAAKNEMVSMLKSLGVDTSCIADTDGYREVIRELGRRNYPGFDENRFDVNG
ncbi:MAG: hypothetical protein GYA56_13685 [Geobacteraceae bacterium]|nr:hypothetical protein [Geobacteraceae bacterium]